MVCQDIWRKFKTSVAIWWTNGENNRYLLTELDLEKQSRKYVADLQSKTAELINTNPQTPEECNQVFLKKKRIVDTIVVEARIDENREIYAKFRTDLLNLAGLM